MTPYLLHVFIYYKPIIYEHNIKHIQTYKTYKIDLKIYYNYINNSGSPILIFQMPVQTRSMTRRSQSQEDDYNEPEALSCSCGLCHLPGNDVDYDNDDYNYYEDCNGHDYCKCVLCQKYPKREPCGCDECQLARKLPTYCHQCSLNIDTLVSKYITNNTKYQAMHKSIEFPRDMRSNRQRMINAIKYFVNIVETFSDANLKKFVCSYNMTQYCEVLCPECQDFYQKYFNIDAIKTRISRLVKSNFLSRLFNIIVSKRVLPYYQALIDKSSQGSNQKFMEVNKEKLRLFAKYNDNPISHLWKGSNHYHKKLFGIPCILEDNGITLEHYQIREMNYMNDIICGHPMASNGWFQESLKATLELFQTAGMEFSL